MREHLRRLGWFDRLKLVTLPFLPLAVAAIVLIESLNPRKKAHRKARKR